MIGRKIQSLFPKKPEPVEALPALEASDLHWDNQLKGVDITLGTGQIVGLGGLDGQGQKELLLSLFGVLRNVTGNIKRGGEPFQANSPAHCKQASVALVPEDRKTEGLMLRLSITDNLLLPNYQQVSNGPFINKERAQTLVNEAVEKFQIKTSDLNHPVETLSGGNQQKVVIAKWLMQNPNIILLNDPTRGIDIGTKQELYLLMLELAEAGKTILFYSTDYAELIGCCNRVLIMYDGRITHDLSGKSLTEESVMTATLNVDAQGTS